MADERLSDEDLDLARLHIERECLCAAARALVLLRHIDALAADLAEIRELVGALDDESTLDAVRDLHTEWEHYAKEMNKAGYETIPTLQAALAASRAGEARLVEAGGALRKQAGNAMSALRLAQQHAGKPDPSYMVLDVTRNTREDLETALDAWDRAAAGPVPEGPGGDEV